MRVPSAIGGGNADTIYTLAITKQWRPSEIEIVK
jgi:hypothetical protein